LATDLTTRRLFFTDRPKGGRLVTTKIMIVLYIPLSFQYVRSIITEGILILSVIIGLLWLSFLDLIDPENVSDDLDPWQRTKDRDE
jgi:hypothetical protein